MIYSHSRLSTFEQCPFKFKLRYIDEIVPEIEQTIESHLGKSVHETLEWLYKKVIKEKKVATITELIDQYTEAWSNSFTPEIKIVRRNLTAKDYFSKGVKFLIDYYIKHKPFEDGTIELEKRILVKLDKEEKYKIQGFVDRIVKNPRTGEYEIHDYKTANTLPTKEKIDCDRQLALYSIGIKETFNTTKNVNLVWHYLAHNTKIISKRTNEQLEQLKKDIIQLIKKIELTTEFPTYTSVLCDWCEYKSMCPAFGGKPLERQTKIEHHVKKKEIVKETKSEDNETEEEIKKQLEEEIKDESIKPEGLDIY